MPNTYKTPIGGFYTKPMFQETLVDILSTGRPWPKAPYTLVHKRDGFICGRTTFVEEGDPTGYKWAMKYLKGEYGHWQQLMKLSWFREIYETVWMVELNAKIKSEAMDVIREIAKGNSQSTLPAARFLAELDKEPSGRRGRPSKEQVDRAVKQEVAKLTQTDEDLARIGMTVIQGGKA